MARAPKSVGPRFRPRPINRTGWWRLGAALGLMVVVLLATSAAANARRFGLRCIDGMLEAQRGTILPGAMIRLDDPLFAPLSVPPAICRDSTHSSRRALERAYIDAAIISVDAAIASGSTEDLQRALVALELLLNGVGQHADTAGLEQRRRALVVARLRIEVEQARTAHQRAMIRIEQAREAGLDDPLVDQLEQELRTDQPGPADQNGEVPKGDLADEGASERSL